MLLSNPASKKAFSLIESALVLAIAGLVIGGIWIAAATVNENMKQQQVVEGWAYYLRIISDQFTKSAVTAKNVGNLDIDESIAVNNTPPAGWTVKAGGCCGVKRAVDPYGNRLYIQLTGGGGFYMGYSADTASGPACRAAIDYILGSVYNKLTTVSLLSLGSGKAGCSALLVPAPAENYKANKLNILEACCPNTSLGFFGNLPN